MKRCVQVPGKSASDEILVLRACFENRRGSVFAPKALWRGATKETALRGSAQQFLGKLYGRAWEAHIPGGSSTEEQPSQRAFGAKTLPPSLQLRRASRAAGLLAAAVVGSARKARFGDSGARAEAPSPPRLRPKSLAAEPLLFSKHALNSSSPRPLPLPASGGEGVILPPSRMRRSKVPDSRNCQTSEFLQQSWRTSS